MICSAFPGLCRNMSNNAISGPLPANWGFGDVFTQLQIITLENNRLDGSLPASYSQGLKSLIVFNMGNNNFSGGHQLQCSSDGHSAGPLRGENLSGISLCIS